MKPELIMNGQNLLEYLSKFEKRELESMDVFIQIDKNRISLDSAQVTTWYAAGKEFPCLILKGYDKEEPEENG